MNKRKTTTETARKRCATCGTIAWYPPRARRCHAVKPFGVYLCWGALTDAPIARRHRGGTRGGATTAQHDVTAHGTRLRQRATRKLAGVQRRIATTRARMARLKRRLVKQQRDARKWLAEASLTDAQFDARRQRALHAAQVQHVRRRLTRAVSDSDSDPQPVTFIHGYVRRGQHGGPVVVPGHVRRPRPAA